MDRKHTKTIIIIMATIIFALLVAVGILLVNAAKIPMPAECPPAVRWDGQVYAYRGEKAERRPCRSGGAGAHHFRC